MKAAEDVLREHSVPEDVKVEELVIEVGAMALVDVVSLKFALEVMSRGTRLEGARFNVEIVPPKLACRSCGHEWQISVENLDDEVKLYVHFAPDKIYEILKCPLCGSRSIEVVKGLDVKLKSIKLSEKVASQGDEDPLHSRG
ncbi:hydrogenase expression/synthesis HypA [Pyrolobus fumarii 1A]|uniref:Hydrogenase expression/synthesis HypA n=1 Tax=Pyrolobus fumarii (strain DSM 11204 / 1A) TaxID=694429 RepID=G0EGV5_PYRF1|nr:hydrogenase/urease maturation nickel metallochaperone HypA [Pyrolobus fumarii]AEM39253.1 hydrogenase expression/synthesis HypA [Pyrolobus fumarii 1A]